MRATGLYEHSDSYRDGFNVERYGFNPTVAFRLGPNTTLRGSYEYFHDERIADRGVSSFNGLPVETDPGTFFGDPTRSPTDATVNLVSGLLEHRFNPRVTLRNRLSYGDYDKFYQNVFPGAVNAAGTTVAISAYNNATTRHNVFNQTDLIVSAQTGRFGHTLLLGTEFGRQETVNFRETGFFSSLGANVTTFNAPLASPTISLPLAFRQNATDTDNQGVTTIASLYAQDQVALSEHIEAVVGLRFDSFNADVTNNRIATEFRSDDHLMSPRVGLIYKPIEPVSLYGSYSLTYLPRAGEQLSSLSLTNQALDPEEFRNYEVGAKWDVVPSFSFTAALYRLDRGNVIVPDPTDPAISILVDAQRTKGLEIGVNGYVTPAWSVAGGYAYQDGEITRSISATAQAGAVLAQLPKHSISLWNKYDFTAAVRGGARRDLPRRRVHLDGQPGGASQLDPCRYRRLLQRDPQTARAGQHREPVRHGLLSQRAQQHQHHAGFAASGSNRVHDTLLTRERTRAQVTLESAFSDRSMASHSQDTAIREEGGETALRLENVSLHYGAVKALDDVSFDVSQGSILCLLGSSGSGKSSALRLIAGLERPRSGQITIHDSLVAADGQHVEPERRHVGMVFQDFALFPHLTVKANVAFGIRNGDRAQVEGVVEGLLGDVGLAGHADRYPHMLSGGERQRVALARALAPRPRILLMDEPFSSLDPRLRDQVREQTVDLLRRTGTTTVLVTHDPIEAMRVADRIGVLSQGRLVQFGTTTDIYQRPCSPQMAWSSGT